MKDDMMQNMTPSSPETIAKPKKKFVIFDQKKATISSIRISPVPFKGKLDSNQCSIIFIVED